MISNFVLLFAAVSVAVEIEKEADPENAALLAAPGEIPISPQRYPTSEFHQFWIVLKRTLLFSRRDWVGFLINGNQFSELFMLIHALLFSDINVPPIICSHIGRISDWRSLL